MRQNANEQGSILVLAILVTLILLGVGLMVMWMSTSDMKVSSNITRRQEAIFAAETGLERARQVISVSGSLATLCTLNCSLKSKDDPRSTSNPHAKGMVLCTPTRTPLEDISLTSGSSVSIMSGMGNLTYTLYIRNDDIEYVDPAILENDRDRRVIIRSEGTARDGLSSVAVETVMYHQPPTTIEGYMGQLGGNAQNTNSAKAAVPLPTAP